MSGHMVSGESLIGAVTTLVEDIAAKDAEIERLKIEIELLKVSREQK